MDDDGMGEIVQEFLVESYENLDQIDVDLVALEQDPGSRELLARVFRAVHTVKGTSGFLGLPVLEGVAHAGENLLARLRDGDLVLTGARTSVLLETVDAIRRVLGEVEASGSEGSLEFSDLVGRLAAALEDEDAPSLASDPVFAPPLSAGVLVEPDPVPAAVSNPEPEPVQALVPVDAGVPVAVGADPETETEAVRALAPGAEPEVDPVEPVRRSAADSTVRVDVAVLDTLMRLVGELVLTRNQVTSQAGRGAAHADEASVAWGRMAQRLNSVTGDLQDAVMKARMQPVDTVWGKFPRVVRDLAAACGKQVSLVMVGRETELDRGLVEAIRDPLTHLVRNAVDHGIEWGAQRIEAGKDPVGTVVLRAFHEAGRVVIEIEDDGAGIDRDAVVAKAVWQGLVTAAQAQVMSEAEVLNLVFRPGFSTAAAVTNVSGRGVGMDVVKTNIEAIGGTVEMSSRVGVGTVCRLTLPLTLAIVPALTVVVGGHRYAVAQSAVAELVAVGAGGVEFVAGAPVYRLRGRLLPLVDARAVLSGQAREVEAGPVVVLDVDGRRFGLVVDQVLDTEEIVVSALGEHVAGADVYAGATILGDGAVALILDAGAVAEVALSAEVTAGVEAVQAHEGVSVASGRRFLLVRAGAERVVAVDLAVVTRLEEFDAGAFERLGSGMAVRYRGGVMPVVNVAAALGAATTPPGARVPVVVFSRAGRSVGLVVDRIVDIGVEAMSTGADSARPGPGVLGGVVIGDALVEVLDVDAAVLAADPHFPVTLLHDESSSEVAR